MPTGPKKGCPVKLDKDDRELLALIYDGDAVRSIPVIGPMGCFIALLHTVGREAPRGDMPDTLPEVAADLFTLWNATSPELQEFLERDGAAEFIVPVSTHAGLVAAPHNSNGALTHHKAA